MDLRQKNPYNKKLPLNPYKGEVFLYHKEYRSGSIDEYKVTFVRKTSIGDEYWKLSYETYGNKVNGIFEVEDLLPLVVIDHYIPTQEGDLDTNI